MTAAGVQREREKSCKERDMILVPQTEIRASRPNPPYKRKSQL
jgi:hypothetical protein